MANAAGMLKESIWRDPDWRRLPRGAQATYSQLLSQKELDRAGMLPLQVSKWAKGCDEVTEAALWDDLKLLEARRFIFVDEDTDELFVRSYMRHTEVTKYPQYLKAASRCARLVGSVKLRRELAAELRRLRLSEAVKVADEIDPGPTLPEPFENPSGTLPEPFENPSGTVNPSGTLPERWGVGERVGVVTSQGGYVGGTRAREAEPAPDEPQPRGDEPPRFCERHPGGAEAPCRSCEAARHAHTAWLAARSAAASEAAQLRAKARDAAARAEAAHARANAASPETRAEAMAAVRATLADRDDEPDDDESPL